MVVPADKAEVLYIKLFKYKNSSSLFCPIAHFGSLAHNKHIISPQIILL